MLSVENFQEISDNKYFNFFLDHSIIITDISPHAKKQKLNKIFGKFPAVRGDSWPGLSAARPEACTEDRRSNGYPVLQA
jgi:hypothetical protein